MFEEHEKCLFHNENNVVLNENSVEGKPCINRESKILAIKIYLYSCYDEHEAPISCNITVYLSWLLHSEDVLGGKFTGKEHLFLAVIMKNCGH